MLLLQRHDGGVSKRQAVSGQAGESLCARLAACDKATRKPTKGRGQSHITPGASPGLSKDVTGTGSSIDSREGAGTDSEELFLNPLEVSSAKEICKSPVLHRQ